MPGIGFSAIPVLTFMRYDINGICLKQDFYQSVF